MRRYYSYEKTAVAGNGIQRKENVPRHEQMQASRLDRMDGGLPNWSNAGMNVCEVEWR